MRKKRRVELHIERREISIFAGPGFAPPSGLPVQFPSSDATGLLNVRHAACPTCGSADLALLADAVSNASLDLACLNQRMEDGSLHFHRSPSGEWWICNRSLQQS